MIQNNSVPFFIGRIAICFFLLFGIYIIYGPLKDVELEMINEILYLFIIPITFIPGTIAACLLLGLPIRLIKTIRLWWESNPYFAFIGLVLGVVILYISPNFTDTIKVIEDDTEVLKEIPDYTLFIVGWFITAFFLLHFYPVRFLESIINIFRKTTDDLDWGKEW